MRAIFIAVTLMLLSFTSALAVPIVYSGYDAGAGSLATAPNSTSAAASFDAATSTSLINFESTLPGGVSISGGNVTNSSSGAALYGYNTTLGGNYFYYVFGGQVTFNFVNPISAFGAYFTGWQIGTQTLTYTDSSTVTLNMPQANISAGGTVFYGFYDAGAQIASITYNAVNDIVAIDDIRYGSGNSAPVPEPSTFLLLGAGLAGFGFLRKRMRK